ncbi:MAG TPA: hypothetical protein VGQ00_01115 [Candidatus Norongarragalinales archaeon]|nr:hypothetical protein [Candidatus Norongarragalinales archaeon]
MKIPNPYENKNYKYLVAIPIVLLIASAFFIQSVPTGVDLRGGQLLTIQTQGQVNVAALKASLSQYSENVQVRQFQTPNGQGLEIELSLNPDLEKADALVKEIRTLDSQLAAAEIDEADAQFNNATTTGVIAKNSPQIAAQLKEKVAQVFTLLKINKQVPQDGHDAARLAQSEFENARNAQRDNIVRTVASQVTIESYSFKEIGSSLSKFFLEKTRQIMLVSFALSAIAVFIIFRSVVPSIAVLFGAITDIIVTLGAMGLFQIPLTLASVAALLMLVGFSLNTDNMLTIRVFRRTEGTAAERAHQAMITGFMMNFTSIAAFGVLVIVANFLSIQTFAEIGAVAVIGSVVDFAATWAFNAPLIVWHTEKKQRKAQATS